MCSPIGYFFLFLFVQSKNLLFSSFSIFFCPHSLNFRLLRIIHIYLFFLNIFFCVVLFFEELAMNFYILLYISFFTSLFCIKSIYSVVYISQSFHLCLFLKMQNLREITFNTMQSIRFKN